MDTVTRGDLVTVAIAGDFCKPRPALVVQSDRFGSTATVTVLLVSSTLVEAPLVRLTVEPSAENGLLKRSQVMVDKAMTVKRDKLGERLGRLEDDILIAVSRAMALFLGFA
ncbi:MAG: type II toxin-antitoxin system PemK/MazF family toxin [Defluviicoccus sp.]|nr:type II toxin-antitoxin system PemK/MazF family toxin [Defluviicoccus sp.]MDE0277026.1 type II toxin-antitoxin system PemK/MazF family toxin [Defluviicoccus sp.]